MKYFCRKGFGRRFTILSSDECNGKWAGECLGESATGISSKEILAFCPTDSPWLEHSLAILLLWHEIMSLTGSLVCLYFLCSTSLITVFVDIFLKRFDTQMYSLRQFLIIWWILWFLQNISMTLGDWIYVGMLRNLSASKLSLCNLTTQTMCVPWFPWRKPLRIF